MTNTLTIPRVTPIKAIAPLVPQNRWFRVKTDVSIYLEKVYKFDGQNDHEFFVNELLEYEYEHKHRARLTIDDVDGVSTVTLQLTTKNVRNFTELDKEYAIYADQLYKDIVYNQQQK